MSAKKGAIYGSVIPGAGTAVGVAIGSFFGGKSDKRSGPARLDFAEEYARQAYKKYFQRDPTPEELAIVAPIYQGADPNIHAVGAGDSYVAQLAQDYKNRPDEVARRQREEYKKKAPEHYGSVDQLFQGSLKRVANDQEKEHYGSLLASGEVDAYTLGQYLDQLPEARTTRDTAFRDTLSGELQTQDKRYFEESILPAIQSQFARSGRDMGSTGFAAILGKEATQQNRQRESFLSGLSADQYGGRTAAAREDYLGTQARGYGLQDYARQRTDYLADTNRNRLYEIQNFNMQKQAYDEYLSRYGKRKSGAGQLAGGILGLGVGGYFGGPQGAKVGYQAGSGIGGYFDS